MKQHTIKPTYSCLLRRLLKLSKKLLGIIWINHLIFVGDHFQQVLVLDSNNFFLIVLPLDGIKNEEWKEQTVTF